MDNSHIRNTYTSDDIPNLLAEIERLKAENENLQREKADIEMMMEMANLHADEIGSNLLQKVDASIKEIEAHVRIISETIPVPIVIVKSSDATIIYANEFALKLLGITHHELSNYKALDFYQHPKEREKFINILNQQGHVSDFHVCLKKKDNSIFWASLFSQKLDFRNETCILTVIYDLTERIESEKKIRQLTEELIQKEEKYLMFFLANQEFGIHLQKIKEIIPLIPLCTVPNVPSHIKGVVNLRGKMIPIVDLKSKFNCESVEYSDQACIIIIEPDSKSQSPMFGVIADAVNEILSIKQKDIESPPTYGLGNFLPFIFGMAKVGNNVKILLNTDSLYN